MLKIYQTCEKRQALHNNNYYYIMLLIYFNFYEMNTFFLAVCCGLLSKSTVPVM